MKQRRLILFLLVAVAVAAITNESKAQQLQDDKSWNGDFHLDTNLAGQVYSVAVDGEDLYIGGTFTTVGGIQANHIAKWDGVSWSPLGSGVNGDVWAITISHNSQQSRIYVGGAFDSAGGGRSPGIARWDGSNWSSLGGGLASNPFGVRAIVIDGTEHVYAGGGFRLQYGDTLQNIAMWDGSTWHGLGGGVGFWRGALPVWSMLFSGDTLVVGGYFSSVGLGIHAAGIAAWDGSGWSPVGANDAADVHVSSLAKYKGKLYAAGEFASIGSVPASGIAEWDGAAWHALTDNPGFLVGSLAAVNGKLFAGHEEISETGTRFRNIAQWDGAAWSALGSGLNRGVFNFASDSLGDLFAVGYFDSAGSGIAQGLAEWRAGSASVGPAANSDRFLLGSNFPNPFSGATQIPIALEYASTVTVRIFDRLGRQVRISNVRFSDAGSHLINLDGSALGAGVYLCEISYGAQSSRLPLTVLK